jgi:hypothetical protein
MHSDVALTSTPLTAVNVIGASYNFSGRFVQRNLSKRQEDGPAFHLQVSSIYSCVSRQTHCFVLLHCFVSFSTKDGLYSKTQRNDVLLINATHPFQLVIVQRIPNRNGNILEDKRLPLDALEHSLTHPLINNQVALIVDHLCDGLNMTFDVCGIELYCRLGNMVENSARWLQIDDGLERSGGVSAVVGADGLG